jgi:aminopeptidase-like protein
MTITAGSAAGDAFDASTYMIPLSRELCSFASGVVADENGPLFARIDRELPLDIRRYKSGDTHNGWLVPENWRVLKAEIRRDGKVVFDGRSHTLGVARYAKSFVGELSWDELRPRLVTNPSLPDAYIFHCMWQYRPWAADWAFSIPYEIFKTLGPGRYEVELITEYSTGEMLVAQHEKRGRSDKTIVFHSNSCHPHMANDGFAGTALLIALFKWLHAQDTFYTYRLVIGPEHVGSVFYLRDMPEAEMNRIVCGVFEEMPGTAGAVKIASSFLGNLPVDQAFANAGRHYARAHELVPWRCGAGNDETVWEAPGYEVPFLEITRSEDLMHPYREYHTSLDTPDVMMPAQMDELLLVFQKAVLALERNARAWRKFDGLMCLSNPRYDLYMEREDPAIAKNLPEDSEKWGRLLDSLLRYFDGNQTLLEIANRHDLPFERVYNYVRRFEEKGLIELRREEICRDAPRRVQRGDA